MLQAQQAYFLAVDIFALTALAMAFSAKRGRARGPQRRNPFLMALFALVVVRSLALITYLSTNPAWPQFMGSFEIAGNFCIIWALSNHLLRRVRFWRLYIRVGVVLIALVIIALPWWSLARLWPLISLLVIAGGLPLVYLGRRKRRRTHIIAPLILAVAASFNGLSFLNVAQFITMAGYGALIYAVFVEVVISMRLRRQIVESLGAETQRVQSERRRLLDVSNLLHTNAGVTEVLHHVAYSISRYLNVDQVIIMAVKPSATPIGYMLAAYSVDKTLQYTSRDNVTFKLTASSALLDVFESKAPLVLTPTEADRLANLYALWSEPRLGPTVIQPIALRNRDVGFLVVGNPISQKPLSAGDIRLLQGLSPQLANTIIQQGRYRALESKAETMAAKLQVSRAEVKKLFNIIESLKDGVIVADIEGKIYLTNSATQRILNKTHRDLMSRSIGWLYAQLNPGGDIEKLVASLGRRSNQPHIRYCEYNNRWLQVRLMPLRNRRREWQGVVVVIIDSTADVTADKAKNQFLKTIAKDLRTPLTTLKGYVDLMLSAEGHALSAVEAAGYLRNIDGGLNKIIKIVNEATNDFNHASLMPRLQLQPVNIAEVLNHALESVEAIAAAKNIRPATEITTDLPQMLLDAKKIQNIIEVMLINACRLSPVGGNVTVRLERRVEAEGKAKKESYIFISVADSGEALSVEDSRYLFDPETKHEFTQFNRVARQELLAGKLAIEAHGGRVWVQSKSGGGNIFYIALPC